MSENLVQRLRDHGQLDNWGLREEAADQLEELRATLAARDKPLEIPTWDNDEVPALNTRILQLETALAIGVDMRAKQRRYFKDRTQENLAASKQAEKAFDNAARQALGDPCNTQ
jgi:hypothetical protein